MKKISSIREAMTKSSRGSTEHEVVLKSKGSKSQDYQSSHDPLYVSKITAQGWGTNYASQIIMIYSVVI